MTDPKYQLELCEDCGYPLSDCGEIGIDGCPTVDCKACQLRMRFKAKFSGITDLEPRKHEIEIVAIEDHQAAVSVLLDSLEEILNYTGGADSALDDEYVVERAQNAIAHAKGCK